MKKLECWQISKFLRCKTIRSSSFEKKNNFGTKFCAKFPRLLKKRRHCSYLLCQILFQNRAFSAKNILRIADEGLLMGAPISSKCSLNTVIEKALKFYKSEKVPNFSDILAVKKSTPVLRNPVRRLSHPPSLSEWIEIRKTPFFGGHAGLFYNI